MKKIGVISDTHGLLRPEVLENLQGCDIILHAGDIDKPSLPDKLREIAPVCAVCGNADAYWAGMENLPETRRVDIFGLRIFMIHNKAQIKEDVSDCDMVVFGHSHKYLEKTEDGVFWLNPGSCGPRRFSMPITMAIINVEDDGKFKVEKIDIPHPEPKAARAADDKSPRKGGRAAGADGEAKVQVDTALIAAIIREVNMGIPTSAIAKKHGIPDDLAEQICRLYLTHPGIDAEGVINKMH